jgi:hypothetical protein
MRFSGRQFAAAAGFLGCLGLLDAAIFPNFTMEDLSTQSAVIAQGNVVRSWTAWDAAHKYIWTHYEIALSDVIRGSRVSSMIVSEPGGSLDGIHQQFSNALEYTPGETAVFFLYQTPIGYWRAVGGPQGKFLVETGGRVRLSAQTEIFDSTRRTAGVSVQSLAGLSLADFKNRVRQIAAAHPYRAQ